MRVLVNGAAGIISEVRQSHEKEIEELRKKVEKTKQEMRDAFEERLAKKVGQIILAGEEEAQRVLQRRIARAKAECEAQLLNVKEQQVGELKKAALDVLLKNKAKFVQEAVAEFDGKDVQVIEIPKGIKVQANVPVKDTQEELVVIATLKNGSKMTKVPTIDDKIVVQALQEIWK